MTEETNDYTYIRLRNIPKEFDEKLTNLAENIGHDSKNDMIRKKIKQIIKNNELLLFDPVMSSKQISIDVKAIHKKIKQKVDMIAKLKGYKSAADIIMDELRKEVESQPKHMLLKNKGFKEIQDNNNV